MIDAQLITQDNSHNYGITTANQLAEEMKSSLLAKIEKQSDSFSPLFSLEQTKDYFDLRIADCFNKLAEVNEYTNSTPLEFIEQITSGIAQKKPENYSEANHTLYKNLTKIMVEQDVCDPPMYSAHDLNHGLYVASVMNQIAKIDPSFISNLANKYNIPEQQVLPIYNLAGLIHDAGYPKLFELDQHEEPVHKSTHAIMGAQIFAQEIAPALKATLLESGISVKSAKEIVKDIQHAIHHHCADSPDHGLKGQRSLQTNWKDAGPLIIAEKNFSRVANHLKKQSDQIESIYAVPQGTMTRTSDLKTAGDSLVHVKCEFVEPKTKPIDVLLRIADNCHVDENRLTDVQKSAFTYNMIHHINQKHDGFFNLPNIKNSFQTLVSNSKDELPQIMAKWAAVSELKPTDWSFRASSLWINRLDIRSSNNGQKKLQIDALFNDRLCPSIPDDEKNHLANLKLMQIIRFEDAMKWVGYPIEVRCYYPQNHQKQIRENQEPKLLAS
ncbi:MAG: hypothetical protein VX185_02825 [Pseudomonadota bacterium]|nr:hypothetical protein [Pseudomonadota bacterium]